MALMLAVAVVAALGGAARARLGSDRQICRPRLRWWAVLVLAVTGQAVLGVLSPAGRGALAAADCAAVGLWCVLNRRSRSGLAGLPVLGAGCALNCVVIALNGGMPVSRWALGESGLGRQLDVRRGHLDKHVVMDASTRLRGLGDAIPIPGLRTVVSVGDVLMLAGIAAAVFTAVAAVVPSRGASGPPRPRARLGATP